MREGPVMSEPKTAPQAGISDVVADVDSAAREPASASSPEATSAQAETTPPNALPTDREVTAVSSDSQPVGSNSHATGCEPAGGGPTASDHAALAQAEAAPVPRPMFGLRRALDAHRQDAAGGDFPEFAERGAAKPPTSDISEAGASVADAAGMKTVPTAPPPATPAPEAEPARRSWFSFRKKPEPAPPAPPPQEPLVDLEPVREAMQAAAERRAQELQAGTDVAASAEVAPEESPIRPRQRLGRIGVLLINLGTPEAPTAQAVRRYLHEFLSDKRVIEKDTVLWRLVQRSIILPLRPRIKARAYRKIWNRANDESPLKTITRSQAAKLAEALAGIDETAVVDWAMRYGAPSIENRVKALIAQGCDRILVLPLYPQYSSATTATACDEVFRVLARIRNQPAFRVAPPYYADPVYIEAVAASVEAELARLAFAPEVILASFHGMPLEYVQKGDPYHDQCITTTKLLRERLGMTEQNFVLTFQSRFGRAEWLQPYTAETLRKLARQGIKSVAVVTPGFSADCLETLEEIAIENAHAFKKKGGKNFAFIPSLNDSERGMLVIWDIATRELSGWV
jgi:ferrochelatase